MSILSESAEVGDLLVIFDLQWPKLVPEALEFVMSQILRGLFQLRVVSSKAMVFLIGSLFPKQDID